MRLTLLEPRTLRLLAPLLLLAASTIACTEPPSTDNGTGDGDGDNDTSGDGDGDGDGDGGDESPQIVCMPGETRCADLDTLEICEPTGLAWEQVPCEGYEQCDPTIMNEEGETITVCAGPCEKLEGSSSSEGCSFFTTSMYQATLPFNVTEKPADAIVIGNPQIDRDATVELRFIPYGSHKEEVVEGPIVIPPGEQHTFLLDPEITIYQGEQDTSLYRSGVVYHAVSDLPVVGYLHAPYEGQNSNGSTLLLPENVMQNDYVVYSHGAWQTPNYFTVIALHDQTTVTWNPSVETAGNGWPLDFVDAGNSGTQLLNRYDNIRIDTSIKYDRLKCEQDLSGTVVSADKPIWLVSAVRVLRLPWCGGVVPGCNDVADSSCNYGSDFAMEQNLPLDYWGQKYVGPASPVRGAEQHYWRVFAGDDDVTINVTPAQPGTPINLAKRGDWQEIVVPAGTDLVFEGNGAFMPVQYVTGHYDNANNVGSPAMIQMVPTAQFLDRYLFSTGKNYKVHYVQVIRESGTADVLLDDASVSGWTPVGDWEIATVEVGEGPHEIHSAGSFGIVQYGYSDFISAEQNSAGYGYMGGMKAEVIFIP
ncbi:IgGFc-binding protein [Enhygromyxa salina]|nr:IgGFc-binding protein [Enhygromyxa salina]